MPHEPQSPPNETSQAWPTHLVLYDGSCGFCHGSVKVLVRLDRKRVLRYAPLQGETATQMRVQYPEIPRELESVVLIENGTVHLRSRVVLKCAQHFAWPWRALSGLALLPRWLTDFGYRLIAKYRYRIWGRADACQVPTPEQRDLYLP
jgi:predicted DCC family thiol-disulfide oxidoreductase YuxK